VRVRQTIIITVDRPETAIISHNLLYLAVTKVPRCDRHLAIISHHHQKLRRIITNNTAHHLDGENYNSRGNIFSVLEPDGYNLGVFVRVRYICNK
jgi:hypothetical protein